VFSLETADGIYVITRGFMNEQRTLENGFTPQVCCNMCQCLSWLVLQDVIYNDICSLFYDVEFEC